MATGKLRQSARGEVKFKAWVGDLGAMSKVVSECEALAEDALRRALAQRAQTEAARKESYLADRPYLDTPEDQDRHWERTEREAEQLLRKALTVRLTARLRQFSRELSGAPQEVLDDVDLDDLLSIHVSLGNRYYPGEADGYGLDIYFRRSDGVVVTMVAPESDWVVLARGKFEALLRPRRPWYSVLRSGWSGAVLAAIPAAAIPWVLSADATFWSRVLFSVVGVTAVAPLLSMGINAVLERLIPAFEVVPDGAAARGRRVLATIGAALLWVLSSIALPIWLTQIGVA